ncbi:hypothetical protein D3C80_923930 [compost metagenome]
MEQHRLEQFDLVGALLVFNFEFTNVFVLLVVDVLFVTNGVVSIGEGVVERDAVDRPLRFRRFRETSTIRNINFNVEDAYTDLPWIELRHLAVVQFDNKLVGVVAVTFDRHAINVFVRLHELFGITDAVELHSAQVMTVDGFDIAYLAMFSFGKQRGLVEVNLLSVRLPVLAITEQDVVTPSLVKRIQSVITQGYITFCGY